MSPPPAGNARGLGLLTLESLQQRMDQKEFGGRRRHKDWFRDWQTDLSNSRGVTLEEFANGVRAMGFADATKDDIAAVFAAIDRGGTGRIDVDMLDKRFREKVLHTESEAPGPDIAEGEPVVEATVHKQGVARPKGFNRPVSDIMLVGNHTKVLHELEATLQSSDELTSLAEKLRCQAQTAHEEAAGITSGTDLGMRIGLRLVDIIKGGMSLADIVGKFDKSKDGLISKTEFRAGVCRERTRAWLGWPRADETVRGAGAELDPLQDHVGVRRPSRGSRTG